MQNQMLQLMQQARAMKKNMKAVKKSLRKEEVTGEAGDGEVAITLNCEHKVKSIHIEPTLLTTNDAKALEKLVQTALSDALNKVSTVSAEKMKAATGGLQLPPGMDLGL